MATLISEFEPNPAGADPATVSFELSGAAGTAFSGFLISVEADGTAIGTADRVAAISGTFDADGILSVSIPDLENPSFTLILTDDTATVSAGDDLDADNDGVIDDASVLGNVLDAVGVVDNTTDVSYAAQFGGTDFAHIGSEPVLMFRAASLGAWFARNGAGEIFDESGAPVDPGLFDIDPTTGDTFGATNPNDGSFRPVLISEFAPNPAGSDPATASIELSGIAGAAFSGFLLSLEADGSVTGTVDRLAAVSGTFDANGLLVVSIPDLENPSFTFVLTDDTATVSAGDDLDADDDGVIDDLAVLGSVLDAVGIVDNTTDISYAAQLGGTDFPFIGSEPVLTFRDASVGDWFAVDGGGLIYDETGVEVSAAEFDVAPTGAGTYGAVNPGFGAAPLPSLSIAATDAVKAEGDAGTTTFTFTITREGDVEAAFDVDWAVSGDVDAADFGGALPAGTLSFIAGQATADITIDVTGDTDIELDETLTVVLSGATGGAVIAVDTASGTVENDDTPVPILISEFQPNAPGADPATMFVELSGKPGEAFSGFLFSVEADSATGNGTVDRVAAVSGTFDANGLLVVEIPDLENPSFTFILTDDTATAVQGDDIDSLNDGTADQAGLLGNVLDAIGIVDNTTDVSYASQLGGTDFPYIGSEPERVFRDGSTGAWYAVDFNGLVYDETGAAVAPEAFDTPPVSDLDPGVINPSPAVRISEFQPNPDGADPSPASVELAGLAGAAFSGYLLTLEGDGSVTGTVDRLAAVSGTFDANGLLVVEIPDLENPSFTFILTDDGATVSAGDDLDADDDGVIDDPSALGVVLDAVSSIDIDTDISYAAQLGGTDFAYTGAEPGLMFRSGSFGDWFAVHVDDTVYDETGAVVLGTDFDIVPTDDLTLSAINPTFGAPQAATLSIAATAAALPEGDASTTAFTFTVTRDGDATGAVSADWAVAGGDADAADFGGVLPSGVVSFAAGETEALIVIDVTGDLDEEANETFTVTLSNPVDAVISGASADGVIIDDDTPVTLTAIYDIQGAGDASAMEGQTVTIEAVVIGDFQDGDADDTRNLSGFYLQDAAGDGDAATSDGIFVFDGTFGVDVNVGDVVQVTGTVQEYFGETQLSSISSVIVTGSSALPAATVISLPSVDVTQNQDGDWQPDLEAYEGMLVSIDTELTVTEMFQLDRFNEIKLSAGGRLEQFTQSNAPDAAGYAAWLEANGARTITYDDGQNLQNLDVDLLDGFPDPFDTASAIRMGDTITDLSGVLNYQWAGSSASGATWRVRSTTDGENTFTPSDDARPTEAPDVGGTLTVASFNVLNYFTTIDLAGATTDLGHDPRGADSAAELDRQTEKLVQALAKLDADVLALMEIENDFVEDGTSAIETLVAELNLVVGAGTYDWVRPGANYVGGDAIAVAFIYDTSSVQPAAGTTVEMLEDSDLAGLGLDFGHPLFSGSGSNRVSLAATFEEIATGETFTAVNNHFKSKGSVSPWGNNADLGDGQGNNAEARTQAAIAVDAWIDSDPTGSGDADFLILGDLNAYAMEDPITLLKSEGYTDLAQDYVGPDAYSYTFDGQTGTLDYALANGSLAAQVTGAAEWHINSDEADVLDYNTDDYPGGPLDGRDPTIFDGTNEYRASDHDPVIVGLALGGAAPAIIAGATQSIERLAGSDADERFVSDGGSMEIMQGKGGDDVFDFAAWSGNGARDVARIMDYDAGDVVDLGGLELVKFQERAGSVVLVLGDDFDTLIVSGASAMEEIEFAAETLLF